MRFGFSLILALAFVGSPGQAVDGVLEINQACVQTGCFVGDAAGYPVTVSSPGSYRLTSNLVAPSGTAVVIEITASNTTLDLNGFELDLSVAFGIGVQSTASAVHVHDGSVAGVPGQGVTGAAGISLTGSRSSTTGVRVNGFDKAIEMGDECLVSTSQVFVFTLGGIGIDAGERCRVLDNALEVYRHGIRAGRDSLLRGNTVVGFDGTGVSCFDGCTVLENSVTATIQTFGSEGIIATGSLIKNNVVRHLAYDGIRCLSSSPCMVEGNVVDDVGNEGGFAFRDHHGASGYHGNQFNDSNGSNANPQVSGGIEIGTNICGGDTTCP